MSFEGGATGPTFDTPLACHLPGSGGANAGNGNKNAPSFMSSFQPTYDMARFPYDLRTLADMVASKINADESLPLVDVRAQDVEMVFGRLKTKQINYVVGMKGMGPNHAPKPARRPVTMSSEQVPALKKEKATNERFDQQVVMPTSYLYEKHPLDCLQLMLYVLQRSAPKSGYVMRLGTCMVDDDCPEVVPTVLVIPPNPPQARRGTKRRQRGRAPPPPLPVRVVQEGRLNPRRATMTTTTTTMTMTTTTARRLPWERPRQSLRIRRLRTSMAKTRTWKSSSRIRSLTSTRGGFWSKGCHRSGNIP